MDLGIAADAQHVRGVELHFRAGIRPRGNLVRAEQWSVDHACYPICGIAAADRNFAIHQGDASHPALEVVRILRTDGGENSGRQQRSTRQSEEPYAFHGRASRTTRSEEHTSELQSLR